jgi:hypothetical protein
LKALLALPLALALTACMSAQEPADGGPISTMSEVTDPVAPEGPFLWACAAPAMNRGAGWQFAIVELAHETGRELVLQQPGSDAAIPLARDETGGADSFTLNGNVIDIAPDGTARLTWAGAPYSGRCIKGDAA